MSYKRLSLFFGILVSTVSLFNVHAQESEHRKVIANIESVYQCKVLKYPLEVDDITGLKMLYIKSNESPYNVSNGVDFVILINKKNEVVYVVKAVMRHDKDIDDSDCVYGLYVIGKNMEGEIPVSNHDCMNLKMLLFQMGKSPEFLNCTTIKYRVAAVPHLIPFSPVSEENRVNFQRFFER
jgi:hypothetical protein